MAAKVEKAYYQFNRGINTEGSLVAFPEGFSADEENYELHIDGSRRRRLGLGLETGGTDYLNVMPANDGDATHTHKWEGVGGDLDLNFKIVQLGRLLHIYRDTGTVLSANKRAEIIDLTTRKVTTATNADVDGSLVDICYGRGDAFVVGKFIEPFFIRYTSGTDLISLTQININERDFEGIDDGIPNSFLPVSATASHTYNLQNRGWTSTQIADFVASQTKQPSKSMASYLGLKRTLTASNAYDNDGVRTFSPAKLVAELFQDSSAPQGHFIRNPFDQTTITVGTVNFTITAWSFGSWNPGANNVTFTTDGNHGLSVSNSFSISGSSFSQLAFLPGFGTVEYGYSADGAHIVSATPALNQVTFVVTLLVGQGNPYFSTPTAINKGTMGSTASNPSGSQSPVRPVTTAWYAGRVWYAGTPYKQQAGRIYFTQIIESDPQYSKCYQVADPTDERISDIVASDGGVVIIPEVGNVLKLLPYGPFLLVFATGGIWQIGGNSASGFFSAVSYSIRKITEEGCVSGTSVVLGNNVPHYGGPSDIFTIVEDTNSGLLVSQNLTEAVIHTLYAAIPDKNTIQGEYDEVERRIVWLYKRSTSVPDFQYDGALCFNTLLKAFTKYKLYHDGNAYVSSVFSVREPVSLNKRLKFVALNGGGSTLQISEFNRTSYRDLDEDEDDSSFEVPAFIITGPETLGDASKFRYAGYVWVFSKKTETGYILIGSDLVPVGESSTKLQSRWDWADNSSAGKWGPEFEVYRHKRLYQPVDASDTFADGQPLLVTKNKVRGRGRALQLKFTAGEGRDSYLAGWHVKNDVHTEQ